MTTDEDLVAVIGEPAHQVGADDAWLHLAGLTVGQDISERTTQLTGPAPQFGLGKSFPGFTPMGPYLVTPDVPTDSDDLELDCSINGEEVQMGRTRDLVFTGTPAGVGMGRTPQRRLADGDILVSYVEGIGELRQTFHA